MRSDGNHKIVDADCHILEPPDIWDNWLPAKFREKAPKLVKDHAGGDAWMTAVGGEPDPIGLTATPGMPFDKFRWFGVTYEEARKGCYNGEARVEDMDRDGVFAEVLFPPQRTMSHFLGDDDDDPFWAAAVDEGVPVAIHINIISRAQRATARKAAAESGNVLYNMQSEATRAKAIGGIMWSSDYPHHGNDWPYSRKVIEETMGHLPAEEKRLITGGNAARIWNLDV